MSKRGTSQIKIITWSSNWVQ